MSDNSDTEVNAGASTSKQAKKKPKYRKELNDQYLPNMTSTHFATFSLVHENTIIPFPLFKSSC